MKQKKHIFFLLLFLMATTFLFAQKTIIKGTIVDELGNSMPGVNIQVKGDSNGVTSDFDGKYQITKTKRGNEKKEFKMMTFNKSGNIEEVPDGNYVIYEENYFPGTIISVKLKLDYENTENLN